MIRKKFISGQLFRLAAASVVVSLLSVLLAGSLKLLTGYYEHKLFSTISTHPVVLIALPSVGITLIYFLRKYLFKGRANKGIKEIYTTISHRRNDLPAYKIPFHFFNGFLTVIFGGSTGIEVSTVVGTAAIGAAGCRKEFIAKRYKTELICAGVTAGIAVLFASPLAGLLFSLEVIARKLNKTLLVSTIMASLIAWLSLLVMEGENIFAFRVTGWHYHALPYFILLSLLAGLAGVYFTRIVIYLKERFSRINNNFIRVNTGALLIGLALLLFPQLYGDSYHALPALFGQSLQPAFSAGFIWLLVALVLIKPLVASLTLGAGGDGGVFAPSIVTGAILGLLVAVTVNHYLNAQVITGNFMLIGAAAMLSAAIYAPLTSVFLVCGLVSGGYLLFIPVFACNLVARYTAQYCLGYTVYTYKPA